MASLALTWTLQGGGWALVSAADEHAQVDITASYSAGTDAAAHFLHALVRLALTDTQTEAEFDAEPEVYRWFLRSDGSEVDVRVVMADGYQAPADSGVVLWASRQSLDTLCRAAVRAFDRVAYELGEDGYQLEWHGAFPRHELEGLRTAWRGLQHGTAAVKHSDSR
ncbi:hypothetical protein QFZ82_007459 [Streptomyces sp. V4I23]|uniref:hypothetical protein n=1 Tax=Streptomyces sp. V4I23 TaxID=3042282 RepID=UPI00278A30FF|nr:hypothetical protein [Streptomyces sp. V4I23]MDQ1012974.1 hypothetical protein [Streptomyces sp. V4I23]